MGEGTTMPVDVVVEPRVDLDPRMNVHEVLVLRNPGALVPGEVMMG